MLLRRLRPLSLLQLGLLCLHNLPRLTRPGAHRALLRLHLLNRLLRYALETRRDPGVLHLHGRQLAIRSREALSLRRSCLRHSGRPVRSRLTGLELRILLDLRQWLHLLRRPLLPLLLARTRGCHLRAVARPRGVVDVRSDRGSRRGTTAHRVCQNRAADGEASFPECLALQEAGSFVEPGSLPTARANAACARTLHRLSHHRLLVGLDCQGVHKALLLENRTLIDTGW